MNQVNCPVCGNKCIKDGKTKAANGTHGGVGGR